MAQNVLHEVAALAARHYGTIRLPVPPGEWSTLVRIVLEQGRANKKGRDWSWIAESVLGTASDTARQTASRLAEILETAGHAGNKASLLLALAEWWQNRIGEVDALDVFRSHSLAHWQDELRAIRGVNWELADRILMIVANCAVFPLDRASKRIVQRHGWMDAASEYDDWQAFFVTAASDSGVDLLQFRQWTIRLGRDFCGRVPDCESCPLKTLLPVRGPVPLDGQE
jgi:endonuclease III-like uncharacterized protein